MRNVAAPPTTTHRLYRLRLPRILAAVLLACVAVIVVAVALQSTGTAIPSFGRLTFLHINRGSSSAADRATTDGDGDGVVSERDGMLPRGVTPFNDELPAVVNLEPGLLRALRSAADAGSDDGVTVFVNSGWRSAEYQLQLLREAIDEYGSVEEASRWVATPETSAHVSGDAVDIGPWDAMEWLSDHGAEYGLCQTYLNESWHFELKSDGARGRCPRMYGDPTEDPRMRR